MTWHDGRPHDARVGSAGARAVTWLARGLAVFLLAMQLAALAYGLASLVGSGSELIPDRPTVLSAVAFTLTFVAFPGIGALIAWHRPAHPVGWLFLAVGVGLTSSTFATEYVGRAIFVGEELPLVTMAAWLGEWGWILAGGLAMILVPLLFPTGRPPSDRWRPFGWAAGIAIAVVLASQATRPGPLAAYDGMVNPFGIGGLVGQLGTLISDGAFVVLCSLGAVSVASLVIRYRRARGIERQQIKWLLYPAGLFVAGLTTAAFIQVDIVWTVSLLALGAMPVGAGIGILRHRLFDIDLVINRTLVYGALTALLAGVYVGSVLVLQAVLTPVTQGEGLAVAISTLAVAALFQPVRRRVQAAVDRRFFRSRYDAQRTVDAFGTRLRHETDVERLAEDLGALVHGSLQPSSVSVWLRGSHE